MSKTFGIGIFSLNDLSFVLELALAVFNSIIGLDMDWII